MEFNDENGLHYNLPGGGVEVNESLIQAVKRKVKEETSVKIEIGPVAFLYEYAPHQNDNKYGTVHSLTTIFECTLMLNEIPWISETPDLHQTDVKWIPLKELKNIILYPNIRNEIINYSHCKNSISLIEEQHLAEYA